MMGNNRVQKMNQLSKEKGTYLLFLNNPEDQNITIGSLGIVNFPKSYYVYVGSALGPGGLKKRISRHLRLQKKIFWHIDYLLNRTELVAIATIPSKERLECKISQQISSQLQRPEQFSISNFGSSDCNCKSHLFCLGNNSLTKIQQDFIHPLFEQMRVKSVWIERKRKKEKSEEEASSE
ncbi:MAG: DUF123 domain-containing protein [Candidatus Heimdallarchaeota archaeon]|nr:DUF123 domain-containing protein [Candidatus Heimdallarchaeota archaeon]